MLILVTANNCMACNKYKPHWSSVSSGIHQNIPELTIIHTNFPTMDSLPSQPDGFVLQNVISFFPNLIVVRKRDWERALEEKSILKNSDVVSINGVEDHGVIKHITQVSGYSGGSAKNISNPKEMTLAVREAFASLPVISHAFPPSATSTSIASRAPGLGVPLTYVPTATTQSTLTGGSRRGFRIKPL